MNRMTFYAIVMLMMVPLMTMGQETGQQEQLQAMIREALRSNPELETAEQQIIAKEQTVDQTGALPDPKLTVGLANLPVNSFAMDQEPMTGKLISVMQMFPLGGKLGLNKKMAEQAVASEKFKKQEIRNNIISRVKQAYYDLYAVDRSLEIITENQKLMQQFVEIAQTRYATGSGLQQDVLRAQVELSKIKDDLLTWQQKRTSVAAKLNALLDRPVNTNIPTTPDDLTGEIATNPTEPVEQTRPLLLAWQEMLNRSETAVTRSKRDYWPDLTLSAGYTQRDDLQSGAVMHDFLSFSASANLPIFLKKQRANVRQKQAEKTALASQYRTVLNNVRTDSISVAAEMERNSKRIKLYRDGIVLQARQSLDAALSGYQVDKVDFLTLINNWSTLQNYELQEYRAQADYQKSLAQYEQIIGTSEFSIQR